MQDSEIADVVSHSVWTFRQDSDLSGTELLKAMLECRYISQEVYDVALKQKGLHIKLASVTRYYLLKGHDVWEYHMGKRRREDVLRLDGKAPISDRYLDMIERYCPVWGGKYQQAKWQRPSVRM
ncbi:hypothetical protein HY642_07095 [Candidatus Woesearchaeota archaeon]|nr:hypothetical protein [Candidatus Woesearchaeota archaeon]